MAPCWGHPVKFQDLLVAQVQNGVKIFGGDSGSFLGERLRMLQGNLEFLFKRVVISPP